MIYPWEQAVRQKLDMALGDCELSPGKFHVLAVSVANVETGEAALIPMAVVGGDVIEADFWRDILGDAKRLYAIAVDAMWDDLA